MWRFPLNGDEAAVTQSRSLLDSGERERADRLRSPDLRRRFILAHAALRQILAAYLGADPAALRFDRGAHGKPALAGCYRGGWRYNLSHSHDLALCAVAWHCEVGVDVEWLRPLARPDRSGAGVLCPAELDWLGGLPADEQLTAFYRLWVRHEALAKATGVGLGLSLPTEDLRTAGSATFPDGSAWIIHDLDVNPAYAAAIALQGARSPVIRFRETSSGREPLGM